MGKRRIAWNKLKLATDMAYAKKDRDIFTGLKIGEMIFYIIFIDNYSFEKEDIQTLHKLFVEYLKWYFDMRITGEDVTEHIERINEFADIDLLKEFDYEKDGWDKYETN